MTKLFNDGAGSFSAGGGGISGSGGNTGGLSGDYFDIISTTGSTGSFFIGGTGTVSDAYHAASSWYTTSTANNNSYFRWSSRFGTITTSIYTTTAFRFTGNVPTASRILSVYNSAVATIAGWGINASDKLIVFPSTGTTGATSTASIPLDQWVRVEMFCFSDASAGIITVRMYLEADSVTPTETFSLTSQNTRGGNIANVLIGAPTTQAYGGAVLYLGGMGASDEGWFGSIQNQRTSSLLFV